MDAKTTLIGAVIDIEINTIQNGMVFRLFFLNEVMPRSGGGGGHATIPSLRSCLYDTNMNEETEWS